MSSDTDNPVAPLAKRSQQQKSVRQSEADDQNAVQERIHHFWFGHDVYGAFPVDKVRFWYGDPSDPSWLEEQGEQLAYIEEHFLFLVGSAVNGSLSEWADEPRSCLALILVLDQFAKRLLHSKEFEKQCRDQALQLCRHGIRQNHDQCLTPVERCFFYGPLLYAERIAMRSIGLQMLENLLEEVSFEANPFHHHRNHLLVSLYQAVAHKTRVEKRMLSKIA